MDAYGYTEDTGKISEDRGGSYEKNRYLLKAEAV